MTHPTDTAYIKQIAKLAAAIRKQDIQGRPFSQLTTQHLDELGANTRDFRKRHSTLLKEGYDWQIARDVSTYEALKFIGLLPQH